MTLLIAASNTARGAAFPLVTMHNYQRERGVYLLGGPPLVGRLPKDMYFEAHDGETPGLVDFMSGVGFVLASSKLRDVWTSAGAEVEYIDARLQYRGVAQPGYFLVNPRHSIRGVDADRSDVQMTSVGTLMGVERLVLREELFEGMPLAVLFELAKLVVQPNVAAAVAAGLCTGCAFRLPDDVRI